MKSRDDLIERKGLWWPANDIWAHCIIPGEVGPAIDWLKAHNQRWGTIIQAGGNVGVYAKALAPLFAEVRTFEPDPTNFACLERNVLTNGPPNVYGQRVALGDGPGLVEVIEHDPPNCGAHRVSMTKEVAGSCVVLPIDLMIVEPDVIWLDVEGYELQALQGARKTLERCKPMIIVELKGLGIPYGYEDEAVHDYLAGLGYTLKSQHHNDWMFQ